MVRREAGTFVRCMGGGMARGKPVWSDNTATCYKVRLHFSRLWYEPPNGGAGRD